MNGRFRKASALLATAGLVAGGLAAGLVATASSAGATTSQTACEAGGCSVGGEAATTVNLTTGESLGVQFTLSDGGTINSVCYPVATTGGAADTGNDTITVAQVGGPFTESGVATGGCVNFSHVNQSAGTTFIASFVDPAGHFNDGGVPPATSVGDVTGIVPTVNGATNPGLGFGVGVVIFSDPLAPSPVSLTPTGPTTATFHFEGDAIGSGTTPFVCSASVGSVTALPVSPGTSGINNVLLTGLTASPSNLITCTVNEIFGSSVGPSVTVSTHLQPPAPTIGLVTPVNPTSVNVAFTGDGVVGATFTATCTSSAGGPPRTATGSSSAVLVGGFTNLASQVITCSVTETWPLPSGLTGLASALGSTAITGTSGTGCIPSGTVAAPTALSAASEAFPGAAVSWAPVDTDCLVGYLVTPTSGSTVGIPTLVLGHGTTTVVRDGIVEGSTYTFTVAAVTGSGAGPASAPTASVTIGTPAAATSVKAVKVGKGSLKVSFKAGNNNGAPITGFAVTCGPKSILAHGSPVTMNGLQHGKSVTCTVKAANSRGTGQRSARSARIKP